MLANDLDSSETVRYHTVTRSTSVSHTMIERSLFSDEHNMFRDTVRKFIDREIRPCHEQWEKDGIVPREVWLKAGEAGLLFCTIDEEYGGLGLDYLFVLVVVDEMARSGYTGPGFLIHCDLVA